MDVTATTPEPNPETTIDVEHSQCSGCSFVYRAGRPGRPRLCPKCRNLPTYQKPTVAVVRARLEAQAQGASS